MKHRTRVIDRGCCVLPRHACLICTLSVYRKQTCVQLSSLVIDFKTGKTKENTHALI